MYAQMVDTGASKLSALAEMSPEERAFQERIDAGIKIEPKDWMTEGYRKTLIRANQQYLRTLQRATREEDIATLPLKEFIAGPLQAGWVNYYEPYERVHAENLARVKMAVVR